MFVRLSVRPAGAMSRSRYCNNTSLIPLSSSLLIRSQSLVSTPILVKLAHLTSSIMYSNDWRDATRVSYMYSNQDQLSDNWHLLNSCITATDIWAECPCRCMTVIFFSYHFIWSWIELPESHTTNFTFTIIIRGVIY